MSSFYHEPETAEEIKNFLNEIRVMHDINEKRIKAYVDIDPPTREYYADICDDYHFMFKTASFLRQSDLLDELHAVEGMIVFPYTEAQRYIQ